MSKVASKTSAKPVKLTKKAAKIDPSFEPTKVALMVACVAATSLVMFAIISASSL